jgi:hypothetical protein
MKLFLLKIIFISMVSSYNLECQPIWYWNLCMDPNCTYISENNAFSQNILCNASKIGCICDKNSNPISSECPEKYTKACITNKDCICSTVTKVLYIKLREKFIIFFLLKFKVEKTNRNESNISVLLVTTSTENVTLKILGSNNSSSKLYFKSNILVFFVFFIKIIESYLINSY